MSKAVGRRLLSVFFSVFRGWFLSPSPFHTSPRHRLARVYFVYFVVASLSLAQSVPPYISYQGRVAKSDGASFTGVTNLTFGIFATNSGGTVVWGPQAMDVHVVDGLFNAILGQDATTNDVTDAFTNASTWVEVICGNYTNEPRQQILSVPYAMRAGTVPDGSIGLGKLASRVVATNAVGIGGVAVSHVTPRQPITVSSFVAVSNLHVSIATTGRPVLIRLIAGPGEDEGDEGSVYMDNSGESSQAFIRIVRRAAGDENWESLAVYRLQVHANGSGLTALQTPASCIDHIDTNCPAGSYDYRLEGKVVSSGQQLQVKNCQLVVYEL
jgi:hypothetical protein